MRTNVLSTTFHKVRLVPTGDGSLVQLEPVAAGVRREFREVQWASVGTRNRAGVLEVDDLLEYLDEDAYKAVTAGEEVVASIPDFALESAMFL